jgi:hypothetical protein
MNSKGNQPHDGIGDREGHDQECGDRAAAHESPDASWMTGRSGAISHGDDSLRMRASGTASNVSE